MRSQFDRQLSELNNKLIEMGALIENAISKATKALVDHDIELARSIIAGDDRIDEQERDIESLCLKLLLNQQPVARDLRLVSSALKMITDMERIGDQAADISEICIYLAKQTYTEKQDYIPKMAEATMKMVTDSINAYVWKDLGLAQAVIDYDDVVDALYITVRKDLIQMVHEDASKGEQAFDLMQIAKYFERIGDHAQNIAEWVIFSITGSHKGKQVF